MEDSSDPTLIQSYSCTSGSDIDEMYGPTQADDAIRQALAAVWRSLPRSKRNVEKIEAELKRLTERAIANYREDVAAFEEIH